MLRMSKTKSYTLTFPLDLFNALREQVTAYNRQLPPGQPSQSFHGECLTRLYQSLAPETPGVVGGSRHVLKPTRIRRKKVTRAVRGPQMKLAAVAS